MKKALKTLLIKTKRQVFSKAAGNNPSLFQGEGYDFSELREYRVGDDIRKIDWIITAKLQKPYTKLFYEERELSVVAVCMLGGSLFFGTHKIKQDVVAEVATIVGYSAIRNSDLFIGAIASKKLESIESPTRHIFGVDRFIKKVDSFNLLGKKADYQGSLQQLFSRIKRRSLVFLIGDFLTPVDVSLLSRKHEVIVVIVRDRFEEQPLPLGDVNLIDPETYSTIHTNFNKNSAIKYKRLVAKNDKELYRHLNRYQVRFIKIYTDEDPFKKLVGLFAKGL